MRIKIRNDLSDHGTVVSIGLARYFKGSNPITDSNTKSIFILVKNLTLYLNFHDFYLYFHISYIGDCYSMKRAYPYTLIVL